ncbi:MAG: hypothetical protein ACXIT9_07120 [Nitritalea sp.]
MKTLVKMFFALLCAAFLAAPAWAAGDVSERVAAIDARVQEVYAMDFSTLSAKERAALRKEMRALKKEVNTLFTPKERAALRKEMRDLKKEMKATEKEPRANATASENMKEGPRGNGLYISTGALIIILLLLIILL